MGTLPSTRLAQGVVLWLQWAGAEILCLARKAWDAISGEWMLPGTLPLSGEAHGSIPNSGKRALGSSPQLRGMGVGTPLHTRQDWGFVPGLVRCAQVFHIPTGGPRVPLWLGRLKQQHRHPPGEPSFYSLVEGAEAVTPRPTGGPRIHPRFKSLSSGRASPARKARDTIPSLGWAGTGTLVPTRWAWGPVTGSSGQA